MADLQVIQQPFGVGLDENTDSVSTAKLLQALNVRFDKMGRLAKRYGVTAYPTTVVNPPGVPSQSSPITSAQKLITYGNELDVIDTAGWMYTYFPPLSAWATKDQVSEATLTRQSLAQGEVPSFSGDTAVIGNVQVFVWQTFVTHATNDLFIQGGIYATAIDLVTGASLFENVWVSQSYQRSSPKIVTGTVSGDPTFVVVYTDTQGQLYFSKLSASSPQSGWSNEATLANDMRNYGGSPTQFAGAFDVASDGATKMWVIYEGTGGVPANVNLKLFTLGTTTLIATAHPGDATITPVFAVGLLCDAANGRLYPAWSSNDGTDNTTKVAVYDTTSSISSVTPQTVVYTYPFTTNALPYAIGLATDGSSLVVASQSVSNRFSAQRVDAVSLAILGPATTEQFGLTLVSRPFLRSGRFYVFAWSPSAIQGTIFLVDLNISLQAKVGTYNPCRPVAAGAVRQSLTGSRSGSSLASVTATGSSTYSCPISVSIYTPQVVNFTATFNDTAANATAEALETIALSGGVPQLYDGSHVLESGFAWYPEISADVTASGGSLALGTFQYQVVYEWYDARGQWHRSAPSPAVSATTSNTSSYVTLSVPTMALTSKWKNTFGVVMPTDVFAIVYRTVAGGTTFYRSTTPLRTPQGVAPPAANAIGPCVLSLSSDGTLAITDGKTGDTSTANDGTLQSQEVLYTTGGVLPGFCPPSARALVQHKNRLWLGGTDDGRTLWYSKQLTPSVAPEFIDAQTLVIDEGGAVTGLASLDDKLVVFKADGVWIVVGDGPNDLGQGGDYLVQRLASDVGCVEPRSIVAAADGIFFQSRRGIEILDRSLSVSWVGRDVQDDLSAHPTITSAIVVPDQRHVRFTANGSAGVVLVYDTAARAWTTYGHNLGFSADSYASAVLRTGVWTYVRPDGTAFFEDATTYVDNASAWVTARVQVDWKKWGGLSGFGFTRRVGPLVEQLTNADLQVRLYVNYQGTADATANFANGAIASGVQSVLARPVRMKNQAISAIIEDSTPTTGSAGTGQGFLFHGIAYEVRPKPGLDRVRSSQMG